MVPHELLAEIVTPENGGKRIEWSVRIGSMVAQKSATMRYMG